MNFKLPNSFNFRKFRAKPVDILIAGIFALVIFKLWSLYASANLDEGQWEQFKQDHQCKQLVSETGIQRLSWQCDDGQVYYRWRQQRE
ncbi:hypothetical protein [Methylicorpusculum sp.]|uniref:hypothetical protein n=1 Tax=Methylicorpusculum sp. TaxID=2713644 RepID=UPI002730166D|nr:hypothetical protein [Methylicorpusculum sp.]MDP2179686.1 hypothetical protein [Methylicorpusculum sp.]MDP3530907.1 hypothetical protein [Methylicorpusculum sp.]MDZ4150553.1 hypothetical protein [Methylicorpusculum sp.]